MRSPKNKIVKEAKSEKQNRRPKAGNDAFAEILEKIKREGKFEQTLAKMFVKVREKT